MRIDVKKVIFIGAVSQQQPFFAAFQKAGIAQFTGTKVTLADLLATDYQDVVLAIKILQHFDVEQSTYIHIEDALLFSRQVIAEKQRLEERITRRKAIREKLQLVIPFGPIPLDVIKEIEASSSCRFRLWTASAKKMAATLSPHLIPLSTVRLKEYFVSVTKEPIEIQGVEEIPLTEEMVTLSSQLHTIEAGISELEHQLKRKASLVSSLRASLIDRADETKRQRVESTTKKALSNHVFATTAWIPETKLQEAFELSKACGIFCEELHPSKNEIPPTYLENTGYGKVGEDLIQIYDTPSSKDQDPSIWVLAFFSLFFAVIVADAGYGLIFFLSALFFRKKVTSDVGRRFLKLALLLGVTCTIWGVLTNSFFSIEFSKDNPIRKYSLLTYLVERRAAYHLSNQDEFVKTWQSGHGGEAPTSLGEFLHEAASPNATPFYNLFTDNTFLEIALLIGVIHLIVGLARYLPRNFSNVGWILFIIGGYLFSVSYLHASSMVQYILGIPPDVCASVGLQLIAAGAGIAFVSLIIKHGIAGMFELMVGVQIFADILSYLRLYALGATSMIVGGIINQMAEKMPFIIALLLVIFAHGINILLAIMGGVIHGLRLNFLEWYRYSFEGEGKEFSPLSLSVTKMK